MAQDLSDDMFLVVRPKSGHAEALTASVRAAISRVDTEQLVSVRSVMTLEDIAWAATGRHRFRAVMVIAFAVLALVLAMVGRRSASLAYSVQQHVRDFGVRRALGAIDPRRASPGHRRARRVSWARAPRSGSCCQPSAAGSFRRCCSGSGRSIWRHLCCVTLVIGIIAALSILGPAWRAAHIDPAVALRNT